MNMRYYISLLYTTFYLWLRPLVKWILRRTTRLCEFQRICYGENKGATRTSQIEYSIDHTRSEELKKVYNQLNQKAKQTALNKDAVYYAVYSVVRVKNINIKIHKRFPEMLTESMTKIWGYRQLLVTLDYLRQTNYTSNDEEHEAKLLKLWTLLQPKIALNGRISKQWQDIGFQGDDPKTDFRGMGLLSLENLLFFADVHTSTAQHVLMRSQHPTYGYSFAIVGINITHMAYSLMKTGEAKTHFYNACKGFPDLSTFHEFFCYLFFEFDQLWRREKPKDIMEFNRVKNKFDMHIKHKLKDTSVLFKSQFVLENV